MQLTSGARGAGLNSVISGATAVLNIFRLVLEILECFELVLANDLDNR